LSIETRRTQQLSEEARDRIAQALRLAEHLGGEAITIPGEARDIADDVIAFARTKNVTHIVVGKTTRSRWFEILNGSIVDELVRRSGPISVHVIGDAFAPEAPSKSAGAPASREPRRPFTPIPYLVALLSVGAALGIAQLARPLVGVESVDLVFLTAIVGVAVRYGLFPSLTATVMASMCYNYFFLPPLYTFSIAAPTNVAAFVMFAIVAFIVSTLATRVRSQAVIAVGRARTTEQLYAFSRKLAATGTLDDVLWVMAHQTASMLKVRVVVLLPTDNTLELRAGYPPEDTMDQADIAAATWTWEHNRPAGRGADTLPGAKRLFLPLRTGRGVIGVLGIDDDTTGPLLTPDQRRLLGALSDQGALAVERVNLVEDVEKSRINLERDRLRAALLTSLSHDLRTPLASILGSAGALRELSQQLSEAEKSDLVATIIEESERLNQFIANLLDMTRLESGAVKPNSTSYDLRESVGAALKRANKILDGHVVKLEFSEDLPLVDIDPVLFEQVLFNLLDNAAKYADVGTEIHVRGFRADHNVCLQILDEGPGIPAEDLELIFERFYRVQKGDRVRAGTGLGLAISRGFIEAMHGTISAANRTDRKGAVLTIMLPVAFASGAVDAAA
jgi:two-component system sensor histidine kinase KdpD